MLTLQKSCCAWSPHSRWHIMSWTTSFSDSYKSSSFSCHGSSVPCASVLTSPSSKVCFSSWFFISWEKAPSPTSCWFGSVFTYVGCHFHICQVGIEFRIYCFACSKYCILHSCFLGMYWGKIYWCNIELFSNNSLMLAGSSGSSFWTWAYSQFHINSVIKFTNVMYMPSYTDWTYFII